MSQWENKDLEQAFKTKLPEWYQVVDAYNSPGPDRVTFLQDQVCPHCGQNTIYCCRNDFGHVDCEPRFVHICVNAECSYAIQTEIQGVSFPDVETSKDYCPWC